MASNIRMSLAEIYTYEYSPQHSPTRRGSVAKKMSLAPTSDRLSNATDLPPDKRQSPSTVSFQNFMFVFAA